MFTFLLVIFLGALSQKIAEGDKQDFPTLLFVVTILLDFVLIGIVVFSTGV